jgi:hypothetical protein
VGQAEPVEAPPAASGADAAGAHRGRVPGAVPRHARARPPRRPGRPPPPRVLRLRQGVRLVPGARRPQGQPPEAACRSSRRGPEAAADGGARVPRVREGVPDGAGAGRAQALPLRRHHRQRRRAHALLRGDQQQQGPGPADRPHPPRAAAAGGGGRGAQPGRVQEAQAHDPGLASY